MKKKVYSYEVRFQKPKPPVVQRPWYIIIAAIMLIGGIGMLSGDVVGGLCSIAIGAVMLFFTFKTRYKKAGTGNAFSPPAGNEQVASMASTVQLEKISLHTISNLRTLKDYVVVDLETTGLSSHRDKIIEIGVLHIVDGQVAGEFGTLINPGAHIPPVASAVNGIRDTDVKDAPRIEDVIQQVAQILEGNPVVGYNVSFDLAFISRAFTEAGIAQTITYGDVLQLARKAYPECKDHKLQTVSRKLGISAAQTHRAVDDCRLTYKVYEICRAKLLAAHDAELAAKRNMKKQ